MAGAEQSKMGARRTLATVDQLAIKSLPRFRDARGVLVPVEFAAAVPIQVARLFWVTEVPPGATRGSHAHKACRQFMICMAGRLSIAFADGTGCRVLELGAGDAVDVPPGIFASETYVDPMTTLLVLCDRPYEAEDYLVDLDALRAFRGTVGG